MMNDRITDGPQEPQDDEARFPPQEEDNTDEIRQEKIDRIMDEICKTWKEVVRSQK